MYAYIEGILEEENENAIVLDTGGIGYEIYMPLYELQRLSGKRGDSVRIYTYFQVSENGIALYGFLNKTRKELFLKLITVNGVGPKAAIAILGTLSEEDLRFAILAEDEKALTRAPGIGAKTAKRIILDLKDKIDFVEAVEGKLDSGMAASLPPSAKNDAIEALVALGYSSSDALRAFSGMEITDDMSVEQLIKAALKVM